LSGPVAGMLFLGVTAVFMVAPGAVIARLLVGRGVFEAVALAPPVTILLYSVGGAVLGLLGVPANVATIGAFSGLVLSGSVFLWQRGEAHDSPSVRSGQAWRGWIGIGASSGAALAMASWGRPTWLAMPPQSYDYLWHQYVVSTIARRQIMGPQNLVPVDGYSDLTTAYQHGAHLVAGLLPGPGLEGTAAGINATLWVAATLLLPISVAVFVWMMKPHPVAVLVSPIAAVTLPDLFFGKLEIYPFAVGLCLLAGVLFAGWLLIRDVNLRHGLALTLAMSGTILIHPQIAIAGAGIIGAVWVGDAWLRSKEPRSLLPSVAGLTSSAIVTALLVLPWVVMPRGTDGAASLASEVSGGAILRDQEFENATEVLLAIVRGQRLGHELGDPNLLVGVGVGVSLLVLVALRRHLGLVLALSGFIAITVLTAAGSGRVREAVGGIWLGDWYRPAGIVALLSALCIGLAAAEVIDVVAQRTNGQGRISLLLAVSLVAYAWFTALLRVGPNRDDIMELYGPWLSESQYERGEPSPFSPMEAEAIKVLAEVTPEGARVMNWWPDGSPWMYTVAGLVPVQTYWDTAADLPLANFLERNLTEPGAEVTEALIELEVCSAFVGRGSVGRRTAPSWTEVVDLPGFELVYSNQHARVYRVEDPRLVEGCG
jgi:hypothetical protein